ncbi:MtnX-like HAD-IB family phosphatase [bacterium]|nr:MtnX-like HAD-IB family phosphatase [bacterium]
MEPCEQVYAATGLLAALPPRRNGATLYVCDFDNTVATEDVGDRILERFGGPDWIDWSLRYRRGEIGSRECLTRQYESFRADWDAYRRFVEEYELDPDFPRFLAAVRARGHRVIVVSDGVGNYISILFEKYGIAGVPVFSNYGVWNGDGRVRLQFPHFQPACEVGCANCKFRHVRLDGSGRKVYIGDGVSDQYGAQAADVIYAKDRLRDFLAARGVPHTAFSRFADVIVAEGLED